MESTARMATAGGEEEEADSVGPISEFSEEGSLCAVCLEKRGRRETAATEDKRLGFEVVSVGIKAEGKAA
jgi:CRISPR/Cas system-associated protein Cas10 (large subunit of type III CRISPR-Cas system)